MSSMQQTAGISGFALYIPPYRVKLDQWSDWYQQDWNKIKAVVGKSFRMRGPRENIYTMAANALLQLICNYQVNPARIRFLALGTESSTDNSAGAVVVKGMVNQALTTLGMEAISRHCEVPEYKHACLGGLYGIKNAARFLNCEPGDDSVAVVVSADIAEYARGSTGEPTQGAGAVAVLLEKYPAIASLNLAASGSASEYRSVDFRKPIVRIMDDEPRKHGQIRDFPVFNGKYSTTCYIEATLEAVADLFNRRQTIGSEYLRSIPAIFMHRPYHRMPESGLAMAYLMSLATGAGAEQETLGEYSAAAGIDTSRLIAEFQNHPTVHDLVEQRRLSDEIFPLAAATLKAFRGTDEYRRQITAKLSLGSVLMMDIGNLYTAALPAWVAAGLEQAATDKTLLAGQEILLLGYGSGDAAEAIPATLLPGWDQAAIKIGFQTSLNDPCDISQQQYEYLHDFGDCDGLPATSHSRFLLDSIGQNKDGDYLDYGIEYYNFLG